MLPVRCDVEANDEPASSKRSVMTLSQNKVVTDFCLRFGFEIGGVELFQSAGGVAQCGFFLVAQRNFQHALDPVSAENTGEAQTDVFQTVMTVHRGRYGQDRIFIVDDCRYDPLHRFRNRIVGVSFRAHDPTRTVAHVAEQSFQHRAVVSSPTAFAIVL